MSDEQIPQDLRALEELLDAERDALMQGDLEQLTNLLSAKEALIDALNAREQTDLDKLRDLDGKVRRNQMLLDSALEGIRSVARRMAALRRIRGSLETYDSQGKKRSVDMNAERSVEKRA